MGIRRLERSGRTANVAQADVCIVGAGVAGLIAGVRIARTRGLRVTIVESGIGRDDQTVRPLDAIANASANYRGDQRARGLGGTSARWAGKLLPLSRSDTEPRPWVGLAGWPVGAGELDRYRPEIEAMMGVDAASYEEDAARLLDREALLPRSDPDFAIRWPKRPSAANHYLAHVLRQQLEELDNLEIWLGATVSRFRFDPAKGRVIALDALNYAGQSLELIAREYVLAAGTLETTRLMLVADRQSGGIVSRTTEVLGRHFNDHLGLVVANLRPVHPRRTNKMLADRWPLGADRHIHFELRREVQQASQIGSAYFDIGVQVPDASAPTQARLALCALREGRAAAALAHGFSTLGDVSTLLRTAHWRYVAKRKYWPPYARASVKIWIEQLPHWRNRIVLSDQCDEFGLPRIHVAFRRTDSEERAFRTCLERLRTYWARHVAPSCRLEWERCALDPEARLADAAVELAHPAGSTRMGTDPATSVVDPTLRVHAIPNLSIASASVFPASGSANPTFTIMQLAMRAADCIADRLGVGRSPDVASVSTRPDRAAVLAISRPARQRGPSQFLRNQPRMRDSRVRARLGRGRRYR